MSFWKFKKFMKRSINHGTEVQPPLNIPMLETHFRLYKVGPKSPNLIQSYIQKKILRSSVFLGTHNLYFLVILHDYDCSYSYSLSFYYVPIVS